MGFDVLQDLPHDAFAQPLALVRLEHGNVNDLEKTPAITDHPPHSHGLRLMKNLHREERIGQTAHRCFIGLAAEAGARAQRLVDRDGRGFEQAGIVSQWRHRSWVGRGRGVASKPDARWAWTEAVCRWGRQSFCFGRIASSAELSSSLRDCLGV